LSENDPKPGDNILSLYLSEQEVILFAYNNPLNEENFETL